MAKKKRKPDETKEKAKAVPQAPNKLRRPANTKGRR